MVLFYFHGMGVDWRWDLQPAMTVQLIAFSSIFWYFIFYFLFLCLLYLIVYSQPWLYSLWPFQVFAGISSSISSFYVFVCNSVYCQTWRYSLRPFLLSYFYIIILYFSYIRYLFIFCFLPSMKLSSSWPFPLFSTLFYFIYSFHIYGVNCYIPILIWSQTFPSLL